MLKIIWKMLELKLESKDVWRNFYFYWIRYYRFERVINSFLHFILSVARKIKRDTAAGTQIGKKDNNIYRKKNRTKKKDILKKRKTDGTKTEYKD